MTVHKLMPTTPTMISIVNESTKVSDADVQKCIPAFLRQVTLDFAPIWGCSCAIEFVPKGTKPNGNVIATLRDKSDVPGALGYHDRDAHGYAYIVVAIVAGYDWRTTMSHEILELLADFAANRWADGPDGRDWAIEMCDYVESQTYPVEGIPLSDFVYPAFFNPGANSADRLDHLGKLKKPFTVGPQDYGIVRTEPGTVSQVYAKHEAEGHDVRTVVQAHESKNGRAVLLIFGEAYPAEQKEGKIAKARRRFAKAV